MFKKFAFLCLFGAAPAFGAPVSISIDPQSPIVINADYQTPNGQVVKAPWYEFYASVQDPTDKYLTIMAIHIESSTPDGHKVTSDLSPSDFNYVLNCSNGVKFPVFFGSFGTFAPGASGTLLLTPTGQQPPADCSGQSLGFSPAIIASDNPALPPDHSGNISYQAKVTFTGWYGKVDSPEARFSQEVDFVTQ